MSDLSIRLAQDHLQLPVSAYFDDALFQLEQQRIFQAGPRYIGHELTVPNIGDYAALAQEGEGRAILRRAEGPQGIELMSNVCRHRQAVMLRGTGSTGKNIVCPLHRWTYGLDGQLVGAPHFAEDPCLHLQRYKLQSWNGLLFEDNGYPIVQVMDQLSVLKSFDFTGYVHDHTELHECNYNWKTFIEVYLEDYHVVPFHPGLGKFVDCDALQWQFAPEWSVQTVGVHKGLQNPGSPVYNKWHQAVLNYRGDQGAPEHGAIWLTLYPNIMLEWYPHVLVISTLFPLSPQKTLNMVEFFYPEEIAAFEREFIEAERAAYMETCVEDDEIAERMDAGRKALFDRGDDQHGPYQSPMEDGMRHFHAWYRGKINPPA